LPEVPAPPLLYFREAGEVLEMVMSQNGECIVHRITEQQAAAMIRDLSQWLYRRIQK
jgi:hypothetical protein